MTLHPCPTCGRSDPMREPVSHVVEAIACSSIGCETLIIADTSEEAGRLWNALGEFRQYYSASGPIRTLSYLPARREAGEFLRK